MFHGRVPADGAMPKALSMELSHRGDGLELPACRRHGAVSRRGGLSMPSNIAVCVVKLAWPIHDSNLEPIQQISYSSYGQNINPRWSLRVLKWTLGMLKWTLEVLKWTVDVPKWSLEVVEWTLKVPK